MRIESHFYRMASLLLLLVCFAMAPNNAALAQSLESKIDALIAEQYKSDEPGVVVRVQQNGKTLFEKAYGMADMELGVKMQPDHILRLGSITKQFTAVAMLMLVQEGKVSLSDDLTKYLPDYPTGGRKISIAQLLNHTSGIKSYTSMDDFQKIMRTDMTLTELIDRFKNEPFDFEPGEKWNYNNSAYILAGAVIEKASGMSYADFVEKRIFQSLGMTDSYYDVSDRVIPRRIHGYGRGEAEDTFSNAPYLSMTLPYAAGSLMSTVADMGKWDEALYSEKLVKKDLLNQAWTGTKLNNGAMTHYGYGWGFNELDGHRFIYHSGGINGFTTNGIRVPDAHLYVVALSNTNDKGPADMSYKIAQTVLGVATEQLKPVEMTAKQLADYVGVYELDSPDKWRHITLEGNQLYSQRANSERFEVFAFGKDRFYFKDHPTRLVFERNKAGKVATLKPVQPMPFSTDEVYTRTEKDKPTEKASISVPPSLLETYAGTYNLFPNFDLTIRTQDGKLFAQATGQPEFELFGETERRFFLKVVDAQVDFLPAVDGVVKEMVLHQGGQDMKGVRK
ncbi:MAG: serine hydrolase [Saprospiraceae bacterium]|nr:serine hydrolase [Saprospiraceae bacterium]MCF8248651.1 serine hydrolase [Saprospiraceae bacterium]MCF8278859.1 serine hydrolase [Bacteroidales bacterium]MCF8310659.1 serine hydrolase [Saprospiraceae bacterium]MCF8439218.1 serine hydrolase [Saprospiraceae bacterium]